MWNSAGIGNDDDEWGTSSKTKGKKKKKKETDEGFHEISLDDVAEAPKIDISFDSKDKKSDSFGFLGGGGWGNSSWSFSGTSLAFTLCCHCISSKILQTGNILPNCTAIVHKIVMA